MVNQIAYLLFYQIKIAWLHNFLIDDFFLKSKLETFKMFLVYPVQKITQTQKLN